MLIKSNSNTNRTNILIDEYLKLINNNIPAENILVLVQNSKKKKEFIDRVKDKHSLGNIGSLKIFSFWGLIREYILENWAEVENTIKDNKAKILPSLCGLEISQYIFKESIEEVDFSGYNSSTSLLHQLFRRNSLINLNNLSKEEVEKRAKILEESYSVEANLAINKYKAKSINLRAFDYIRQINIFEILYKKLKNTFDYVFVDDADEITPCVLAYLKHIKPKVKEFFIGYDPYGSSRLGYLGAINVDFEEFLQETAKTTEDISDSKTKEALYIFDCIQNDKPIEINSIQFKSFLKRNEMTSAILAEIRQLINNGVKPSEIAVVTPLCDNFLKTEFNKSGFKFNFISKNEKLNENKLVGYLLEFLKIINDENNTFISPYVLKGIFIELLNFDKKESIKLIQEYKIENKYQNTSIFDLIKSKDTPEFQKLIEIYEKIRFENLSNQLYEIIVNYIKIEKENSKDIIKINRLLKQISDFEEVFEDNFKKEALITQLENTIISENPLSDEEIEENSIVVSTAQKIIDYSYKTKYQFLIDVSSENWIKQDIGPLYNAWVMQKTWNKDTFELTDNINLTKDRTARMLYKLNLLAGNTILYSSVYDYLGAENFSGIDKYFKFENSLKASSSKPITPRADQKAVLDYNGGLMSVSATAGSGKTTIMLLLVDKILSGEILDSIESKNIFVLTFMESAARNFKERIKAKYPNLKELPNISTIHGLALRILKENNNYSKVGLDYDFEILDEIKRSAILAEIIYANGISPDKQDLYDSAISSYKNELATYHDFKPQNRLFMNVFEGYQNQLKKQNLIDYDDLLLLSLRLLKENKDVLNYYQDLVKIIIEDEAQDSSFVQQSLIMLLGGKYKNIIRCGDINQAITSTFTNSDVEGFKKFMKNSNNVVMDRCQRCSTGVLDCANNTVKYAKNHSIEAFSDLIMKPVEGVNIVNKNSVIHNIFENEKDETNFVVNEIKNIIKTEKTPTIGILLRSNFAINKWAKLLETVNIKTYRNSDNLINNPVYKICLLVLEYICDPYDVKAVQNIAQAGYEAGLYDSSALNYANSLNEPLFLRDDFDEQFFWDMNYFLFKNHYSIYDLVEEIGSYYFSSTPQSANISMVATIAQRIRNSQKNFEATIEKLKEIKFKNNFSNIKFFATDDNDKKAGSVQIMTLHKSKGDEFDFVFIPELTQDNLCLNIDEYKLKDNSKFIQKIKKYPKTDLELKKDIVEENYRLIYVGITRARNKLYLSSANCYKFYNKDRNCKISEFMESLE